MEKVCDPVLCRFQTAMGPFIIMVKMTAVDGASVARSVGKLDRFWLGIVVEKMEKR